MRNFRHHYDYIWLESDEYTEMLERDFGYEINQKRIIWLVDLPEKQVHALIDAIEYVNPFNYTTVMK